MTDPDNWNAENIEATRFVMVLSARSVRLADARYRLLLAQRDHHFSRKYSRPSEVPDRRRVLIALADVWTYQQRVAQLAAEYRNDHHGP